MTSSSGPTRWGIFCSLLIICAGSCNMDDLPLPETGNAKAAIQANNTDAGHENHAPEQVYSDAGNVSSGDGRGHDALSEHEAGVVRLDEQQRAALNLRTAQVRKGAAGAALPLPAETQFDPDRMAHLVPRVEGIVRSVRMGIGDEVNEGEVMAVLDSRELAEAQSKYLAALAMRDVELKTFQREQRLYNEEISSEDDYLEAKKAYEKARINVESAKQQLHALGLSNSHLDKLPTVSDSSLTRYEITAPFAATVISRHITLGETIQNDDIVYTIANPDPIWVMGQAYERQLRHIELGQKSVIRLDAYPGTTFEGAVDYVGSTLDPESRTLPVRVILPNGDARIREGLFGQMLVFTGAAHPPAAQISFVVPADAIQRMGGEQVVFIEDSKGVYRAVAVVIIERSERFVEVQGNLVEGERVVTNDTFILKSELGKAAMGGGHSH